MWGQGKKEQVHQGAMMAQTFGGELNTDGRTLAKTGSLKGKAPRKRLSPDGTGSCPLSGKIIKRGGGKDKDNHRRGVFGSTRPYVIWQEIFPQNEVHMDNK